MSFVEDEDGEDVSIPFCYMKWNTAVMPDDSDKQVYFTGNELADIIKELRDDQKTNVD